MSYSVPTVAALAQRAWAALRSELRGTDASLDENNLNIVAKVWGLLLKEVHLRIKWALDQIFVETCDEGFLLLHARAYGMTFKPAARASGTATTTAASSTTYPAGLRYLVGTMAFVTTAAATSNGSGALTLSLQAAEPGGAGNIEAGASLTFGQPGDYPALGSTATASAAFGGGADRETLAALRARVALRRKSPPRGGSLDDYEAMALEVSGVTNAWAEQYLYGGNRVSVWFLFEGRTNGIPEAADVATVSDYIDSLRRVTTGTSVQAPTALPVDITISGLENDTTATREAIEAALSAEFLKRGRPGVPAGTTTFSRSWIEEAISNASGEDRHILTVPTDDIAQAAGEMPVLGTVTYLA